MAGTAPARAHLCAPGGGACSLRLREPTRPNKSPHWTSNASNVTYATAWDVVLRPPLTDVLQGPLKGQDVVVALDAIVPHAENKLSAGTFFWEGAATATATADATGAAATGWAFVEQMGYS